MITYRKHRWDNSTPEFTDGTHVFVLYHSHRKSFWKTTSLSDALHMFAFLTSMDAEFRYQVWS